MVKKIHRRSLVDALGLAVASSRVMRNSLFGTVMNVCSAMYSMSRAWEDYRGKVGLGHVNTDLC